jgi:GDP-4-dehydro-6-deoxy-D-mannose reductase
MPVWLVTGGSGFLGRHVLATLKEQAGTEVLALGRRCPPGWPGGAFVAADLERPEDLARSVAAVRPEVVIHAAGRTPPAEPGELYHANTLATLHLLDALRASGRPCRIVLAGSAAELGPVEVGALPVGEDHPCRPAEAYGLSKWLATCAALAARPPLEAVAARVFNLVGPGQPERQAFGRFAARLICGAPGPLVLDVTGLEARRDFLDVRDAARAVLALADRGRAGRVYHVGTGRSHAVGEGLAHLIRRSGRAVEVRVDEKLAPGGPSDSRADIARVVAQTGWRPEIAFEQSLDDLWDEAVSRSGRPSPLPLTP